MQTRVFGFHHDVDNRHGNVGFGSQDFESLRRGIGVRQFQSATIGQHSP
jgi:hypothetical protein